MHNLVLSPIDPERLMNNIADKVTEKVLTALNKKNQDEPTPDPLDDLIPKSEVRGKLASASTLWKYEKEGKIKSYAIGGKRFYKRSELMEAFTELKQ